MIVGCQVSSREEVFDIHWSTTILQYTNKDNFFPRVRMLHWWNTEEIAVLVPAEKLILRNKGICSSTLLHSITKMTPQALWKQIRYLRPDNNKQSVSTSLRSAAIESLMDNLCRAPNFRRRGPEWPPTALLVLPFARPFPRRVLSDFLLSKLLWRECCRRRNNTYNNIMYFG